jgi:ankyrin repeat protein
MDNDLHIAAGDDDLTEVKRLLSEKADPNAVSTAGLTPLHVAAGEVLCPHQDDSGFVDTPDLILQGAESVVEYLCNSGANVNAATTFGKETPLHKAASDGHYKCIVLLTAASADLDALSREGNSALHEACREGNTDTVRVLLEQGPYCRNINTVCYLI